MHGISKGDALAELHRRGMPVFAGGDPRGLAMAADPAYPLGPPSVSGQLVTVDMMLNDPTRITRMISDITLQRFLLDKIFTNAGGVQGGAVIYDLPLTNDLYPTRDIQRVEPAGEFPILTSAVPVPTVATPEKWGAKTFITDEARDRNNNVYFMREQRKVANVIVRKLNQRAVEQLDAIFTAYPAQTFPGHDWTTVTTLGTTPTAYSSQPIGDLVSIQLFLEQQELGISFDTILMNPTQRARLQLIYGDEWRAVLTSYGYTNVFVSNRVPVSSLYALLGGQVGQLRVENPLGTVTWRDNPREITWSQSSVRPLMFVDEPLNVVKLTGLGT